jgi:hypothetical protein
LVAQNRLDEAYPLFADAVQEAPSDPDAHAWLAETARRRRQYGEAHSAALTALELDPCHAFAHTVLGSLFQPIYGAWPGANSDSAWSHLKRAVECDPSDGNALTGLWVEALRRGERTPEIRALEGFVTTGFLTSSVLAFNRWVLQSLPANALLLTNGDWDTYPALALQVAEDFRSDVGIVNLSMLNLAWYARLVSERYGVPLPFTPGRLAAMASMGQLPDSVVGGWRAQSVIGTLGRPLTAAATVDLAHLEGGVGSFREAGPHLVLTQNSTRPDTAAMRAALSAVAGVDFASPEVSSTDRSAVRMAAASGRGLASVVLHTALRYASLMLEAERVGEGRAMIEWSERFVNDAGLAMEHGAAIERVQEAFDRRGAR